MQNGTLHLENGNNQKHIFGSTQSISTTYIIQSIGTSYQMFYSYFFFGPHLADTCTNVRLAARQWASHRFFLCDAAVCLQYFVTVRNV